MLPQYGTACQRPHVKLDAHAGAPTSLMQDRQQALQQPQARRLPKLPSASACNTARNSKAHWLASIRARAAVHRQTDSADQVQQSSRPVSRVQRGGGLCCCGDRCCGGLSLLVAASAVLPPRLFWRGDRAPRKKGEREVGGGIRANPRVEQRRLAAAEEAGEHGDRHARVILTVGHFAWDVWVSSC